MTRDNMVNNTDGKPSENPQSVNTAQNGVSDSEDELKDQPDEVTNPEQTGTDNQPEEELDNPDSVEAEELALITAERDTLKDQLLRALADTENMRRRSEREAETARKYGHTQFARDLVSAIDNLARALASAPADKTSLDASVQSLLTGIELSWTEIQTAIEKHGVSQINPVGEKFDYNFHQAMFEVATDDQPPGMVLEVVQHGYALHDRLLRPALVGVSKSTESAESETTEK